MECLAFRVWSFNEITERPSCNRYHKGDVSKFGKNWDIGIDSGSDIRCTLGVLLLITANPLDSVLRIITTIGISILSFVLATILLVSFAVKLKVPQQVFLHLKIISCRFFFWLFILCAIQQDYQDRACLM